jgi:isoleucyl-tRNA synthetase
VLLTYWNTAAFLTLYAEANGWTPGSVDPREPTLLDRWALSQVHATALEVTAALEDFDSLRAGRALATCIDDLSNWYVRTSRRRFWDGDPAALSTLHECLYVVTLLLAPFTPFITDEVWEALYAPSSELPDSVHLATWPKVDGSLVDDALARDVGLVRRLVDLGRAARAESKTKTRQPLARALVSATGWEALPEELKALVAAELNVVTLERLSGDLVDVSVKANFRVLGKRFGKRTQTVADAIHAADPAGLAAALTAGTASVTVEGETVELSPDEVIVTETPRTGWAVASGQGETVALDLEITPELRQAGLVRDVVRLVQDARKSTGLEVSDRIELWWQAGDDTAAAVRAGSSRLAEEVLAVSVTEGAPTADLAMHEDEELGLTFWLRVAGG